MPENMVSSHWKIWLLAARPKTLWAAVSPVIVGSALALDTGNFHFPSAIAALLGAVLIQIGTNFANDYFDYVHGADTQERTGPTRATQAGWISPQAMKRAFIVTFALAVGVGAYLIYRGGWPILMIGLFSILFGILYTGGPYPLGYHGLGDLFVLIFFGPVAVGGTYYVQALHLPLWVLLLGLAPGLLSVALLTVNNLRDIHTDKKSGKRTLVVRFGEAFGRAEYVACVGIAGLLPPAIAAWVGNHVLAPITLLICALAFPAFRIIFSEVPGPVYNRVLAQTGKLLFFYSIVFSFGWLL